MPSIAVNIKPKNTSVSSSNSTTNTEVQKDTNIYIPSTQIRFSVTMMKPYTRVYPYFDGKDVSAYVTPTGGNIGDALITDRNGDLSGEFSLPNNDSVKFIAGQRELKLTDSSTNGSNYTTLASTTYTYTGSSDEITPTNNAMTPYTGVIDPLIQSFFISDKGGAFISKIGLFFYTKDEVQPILLQIREVVNNAVSSSYLSGSSITIPASVIKTSTDSLSTDESAITWIEFANPIYLAEGKEYAIFMVSNSNKYILHTVEYGTLNNNIIAEKSIAIRSLIQNQGGMEWSRDNSRGLKLIIQKCKFEKNSTFQLNLVNSELPKKTLSNNSLSTSNGESVITVTDDKHSFNVGSYVEISNLQEGTYAGIPSWQINGIHQITAVTWNSYSFDNYYQGTQRTTIDPADSDLVFGIGVQSDQEYQYDNFYLNNNAIVLTGTNMIYNYKDTDGQSLGGNEQAYYQSSVSTPIVPKILITNKNVKKIASSTNSNRLLSGGKSTYLNINMSTSNENISPILDLNNNLIIVENLINNENSEETTNNGNACARYISKNMSMNDPAQGLRIQFLASVQPSSSIKVYYKTLLIGENNIDLKNWREMTLDKDVLLSNNEEDFQSYVYSLNNMEEFIQFKIKIVMNSTNSTKVPLIRNLTAVAFASSL